MRTGLATGTRATGTTRRATPRRYLMCPPTHFAVTYRINPWMWPAEPVDRERARTQWEHVRDVYRSLGHQVEHIDPVPGLPDMVFAANAALMIDGRVFTARFRHPQRRGEEEPYRAWLASHGFTDQHVARHVHEGEGDFAVVGDVILAGYGFRSSRASHDEARELFGRRVVGLRLVDPRYYHLDTALCVLDDEQVAYYPDAFDAAGRATLAALFPDAIHATAADAAVLGLNAISDGRHVVMPAGAPDLARRLADAGYVPVPVDVSELRKAGGAVKCCTLELRSAPR